MITDFTHADIPDQSGKTFFITGAGDRTAAASRGKGEGAAKLVVDAEETRPADSEAAVARPYRVRLMFAAPLSSSNGIRKFDVAVEGETVLRDVTLDPAGVSSEQHVVHTLDSVMISESLDLQLIPKVGSPVLSGIEITQMPQE